MVWWGGTGRCGKGRGGGLFLVLSEKVNGHQVRNAVVLCAHETFRVTRSSFLFSPPLSLFYYYFYYSSYLLFNPSLPSTISYRFFYLVLPRNECFFFLPPHPPSFKRDLFFSSIGPHNAHPFYYYNGKLHEPGLAIQLAEIRHFVASNAIRCRLFQCRQASSASIPRCYVPRKSSPSFFFLLHHRFDSA